MAGARRGPKLPKGPSRDKAAEMLRDGTVHGQPLTQKQRGLFGSIASGAKRKPAK